MKTQGEIEAAICEGIRRFEQEFMGRGPKDIRAHLIGDLVVVRLQGVLDRCRAAPGEDAAG